MWLRLTPSSSYRFWPLASCFVFFGPFVQARPIQRQKRLALFYFLTCFCRIRKVISCRDIIRNTRWNPTFLSLSLSRAAVASASTWLALLFRLFSPMSDVSVINAVVAVADVVPIASLH